jgi:hypothetical protein
MYSHAPGNGNGAVNNPAPVVIGSTVSINLVCRPAHYGRVREQLAGRG